MATGHWELKTKTVIDPETGQRRTVSTWVWVADPASAKPKTASNSNASADHRRRAQQQAALAAKLRKQAAERARLRMAQEKLRHDAAARAAYQKQLIANRHAAYEQLKATQAKLLRRAHQLGEDVRDLHKPPTTSVNVRPTNPRRTNVKADDARGWASKSASDRVAAEKQARERAYQQTKLRLAGQRAAGLGTKQIAPGVPVTMSTQKKVGVYDRKTSKEAEALLKKEVARAGTTGTNMEHIRLIAEQYDKYAASVAERQVLLVQQIETDLAIAKDPKKSDAAREAAYKRAVAKYRNQYAQNNAEYARLYGDGRKQGDLAKFFGEYRSVANSNRDWWKNQMKAALQSRMNQLQTDKSERHQDSKELQQVKAELALYEKKDGQYGTTIDHYEYTTEPDGTRTAKPVYRPKTLEEALADQQAQIMAEQTRLWEQQRSQRQVQLLRDKGLMRAEGLVRINADGQVAKPGEPSALYNASELQVRRDLMAGVQELFHVDKIGDMPPVKRTEDLAPIVDKLMSRWERLHPAPTSTTGERAGLTEEIVAWEIARAAYERQAYGIFGADTPGFLGRAMSLPGVSHGLAILSAGVSSIGGGLRMTVKLAGGTTSTLGFDYDKLPASVRQAAARTPAGSVSGTNRTINAWLKTPEGMAWAQQQYQESQAEDNAFAAGFYGNGQGPLGLNPDLGTALDALNTYGSSPTGSDQGNLLFQLIFDPTNAIPLKFTTYAARAAYATKLAKAMEASGKFSSLKMATKFARDFVAVDEGVLKLEKELGQFAKELQKSGRTAEQATRELAEKLAGVADPADAKKAIEQTLRQWGIDPRKVDVSQIQNLTEWAVSRDVSAASDLLTADKKLAEKIKQADVERERALAQKLRAEKAAREEIQKQTDAQAEAGRQAARDLERQHAAEAKAAADAVATPKAEAVAGQSAAAAREATGTPPAARPVPTPKPKSTVRNKVESVFERRRKQAEQARVWRDAERGPVNYEGYEAWREYYEVKDGVVVPKEGRYGGPVRQQFLSGQAGKVWNRYAKRAAQGDEVAQRELARLGRQMRDAFRTAIEDAPSVRESHFTPSWFDLAERAAVANEKRADDLLRESTARARHLQRMASMPDANTEYIRGYRAASGGEEIAPAQGRRLNPTGERRVERPAAEAKPIEAHTIERQDAVDIDAEQVSSDWLEIGEELLLAKAENARGVHAVFQPFAHRSLAAYAQYAPSYFKELRNSKFIRETLTPDMFAERIARLSGLWGKKGAPALGEGLVGWRDGGFWNFEVFHQLRLEGTVESMAKLQQIGLWVDEMLSVLPNGEPKFPKYYDNIFLRQWQVMEGRVGLPWAHDVDLAAERFREAAVSWGVPPDISLSMIPNGYNAQRPSLAFGLSDQLKHLEDSNRWLVAPANWTVRNALDTITSIFTRNVGEPMQVVHYVAQRYGDFWKGSPVMNRLMDELTHRAIVEINDLDGLAETLAANMRRGSDLDLAVRDAQHVLDDFEIIDAQRASFDARKAAGQLPADAVFETDEVALRVAQSERDRALQVTAKSKIKDIIESAQREHRLAVDDPRLKKKLRPDYQRLRQVVFDAYWAGDLPLKEVRIHDLMYLVRMQTPGWGERVLEYNATYAKYMRALKAEPHMQEFLRGIHERSIANAKGRFIVEQTGTLDQAGDEAGRLVHNREYTQWRELGLLDWTEQEIKDYDELVGGNRMRMAEEEAHTARENDWLAHERDKPADAYTGSQSADSLDKRISAILGVADDEERQFRMLSQMVAQVMDGAGAKMTSEEDALLERLWRGVNAQANGAEIMRRVSEQGHEVLSEARTPSHMELLAFREASIRIEITKIKRVGKRWDYRLPALQKELSEIARLQHAAPVRSRGFRVINDGKDAFYNDLRVQRVAKIDSPRRVRVAARYVAAKTLPGDVRVEAHILYDQAALRVKFARKAWTKPALLADGTRVAPLPADAFKTFEEFRDFTLEHEWQHHHIKIEPGETRGAYEQRVNEAALAALRKPEPTVDMVGEYVRSAQTDEMAMQEAQRAAAKDEPAKMPETHIPTHQAPTEEVRGQIDARAMWLERLTGMTEHDYWKLVKDRAHKVLIDPKATETAKADARAQIQRVELAEFAERVDKSRGTYVDWKVRAKHRKAVVDGYGEEAAKIFAPKLIAPFARDLYGATVEQARTWRVALANMSDQIASGVPNLGPKRAEDHFPIELFDQVEPEMAEAVRRARGWSADTRTRARRGRKEQTPTEFDELGPSAPKFKDTDEAILAAKKRVARKYGISVAAYDEARAVLYRGYMQRKTNQWLIKRTDRVVELYAARGIAKDWEEIYLRLRAAEAKKEAYRQLGGLAFGEMMGVPPVEVFKEFERRYGLTKDLQPLEKPAWSRFQRRTLEEAINARTAGVDHTVYFQSANRPPFEQGREAVRDWLVKHGQWSPRQAEDFTLGAKSWSVTEEAKYWGDMFGYVPDWTNPELLRTTFRQIFHDSELYSMQMKDWGIFNKSPELMERLEGKTAQEIEAARIASGRREIVEQRRYVIERYGDLVTAPDGTLTAFPWLMTPEEYSGYLAREARTNLPEGLIQSQQELDQVMGLIQEAMKPYVDRLLKLKEGEQIAYEELYAITTRVQEMLLADPVWSKRMRDRLVGDPLNMWTKLNRWLVFSNPSFLVMNVVDVPIKTGWYRFTRQGLFRAVPNASEALLERVRNLTPAHFGLDAQSTLYNLKDRKALDYFQNPRDKIRVGPVVIDETKGIGLPVIRAIEYTEGFFHALPELAGRAELAGKMNLARDMYPTVYTEALARLGDEALADVWARNFIKKEMVRMWPTVGDGPLEKLFNRIVPFASYSVRNKVLFIAEAVAHPAVLVKINFIAQYVEQQNLREWEADPATRGTVMPDFLRRRIRLPWTRDKDGQYMFLDLSSFSDASRGLKPLMGYEGTQLDFASSWVRLINPSMQAGIYMILNAMNVTTRTMYRPVLNADGYPSGSYTLETTGWTNPWDDKQPDLGSVFWFVDSAKKMMEYGADGWTAGEMTQMLGQAFMYNNVKTYDRGTVLMQLYKSLAAKDKDQAAAWLNNSPDGMFLKSWLIANATKPREVMDAFDSMDKALNTKAWFRKTAADRDAITAGRAQIKAIRAVYAAKLAGLDFGTNEYRETKAQMYYEINNVYLNTPALMKDEVWTKTPAEWAQQLADWQTDKLLDDYFALSSKRPKRAEFSTRKAYEEAVYKWENAKSLFLHSYPQVADALKSSIGALDAAREAQNKMWDYVLGRIDQRNGMIEDAKAVIAKYGYQDSRSQAAQDQLDILYVMNDLDYNLLNRDYVAEYFQPEDFDRLPYGVQGPVGLRAGIKLPRFTVLADFSTVRYEKAMREGTVDAFLANEQYGKDMKAAISYAKGGDPFGEFDGRKWAEYMQKHPDVREKYFARNMTKELAWVNSSKYIAGITAAVNYAKAGGKFDPVRFVAYVKSHPDLAKMYFARNPGKQEKWAATDRYIRHISVWGKLMQAHKWDEAKRVWDAMPQDVKNRYYAKHPERRKRAAQTAEYLGYMKEWVKKFDSPDKTAAMTFFKSMPKWVRDRYYAAHPDKKMKYETDARMWTKVQNYFATETPAQQADYLRANPDLKRWMAQYGGSAAQKNAMILNAYSSIPASEQWLRKIFREKYPEIFSVEAKGQHKLERVAEVLAAHPELNGSFDAWVKQMMDSYAEMMKNGKPRPLSSYITMDRKVPARKFRKGYSAEWVSNRA